ncbi:mucin-5AC-like [Paramacrobiotus metropolitanus]|uniref:mucin-5AC-like n=1 Tax=Paramacrobiotus metropolitanus TaxID=2943436 RepID=UPI0024462D62|nr:mucin-5AC-like [Paramacrobiotus metropolitanus]
MIPFLILHILVFLLAPGIDARHKRQVPFPNLNDMINQAASNVFQRVTSNINNTFPSLNFFPVNPQQPSNSASNGTFAQGRSLTEISSGPGATNITINATVPVLNSETSAFNNISISLSSAPTNTSGPENHTAITVNSTQPLALLNTTTDSSVPALSTLEAFTMSTTLHDLNSTSENISPVTSDAGNVTPGATTEDIVSTTVEPNATREATVTDGVLSTTAAEQLQVTVQPSSQTTAVNQTAIRIQSENDTSLTTTVTPNLTPAITVTSGLAEEITPHNTSNEVTTQSGISTESVITAENVTATASLVATNASENASTEVNSGTGESLLENTTAEMPVVIVSQSAFNATLANLDVAPDNETSSYGIIRHTTTMTNEGTQPANVSEIATTVATVVNTTTNETAAATDNFATVAIAESTTVAILAENNMVTSENPILTAESLSSEANNASVKVDEEHTTDATTAATLTTSAIPAENATQGILLINPATNAPAALIVNNIFANDTGFPLNAANAAETSESESSLNATLAPLSANATEHEKFVNATSDVPVETTTTEEAIRLTTASIEPEVTTEQPSAETTTANVSQSASNETHSNLESASEDETSGYGIVRHSTTVASEVTFSTNATEIATTVAAVVGNNENTSATAAITTTEATLTAATTQTTNISENLTTGSNNSSVVLLDQNTTQATVNVTQSSFHSTPPAISPTTLVWTLPEFQAEGDSHLPSRTMLILNAKNGWREKNQQLINQFKPEKIIQLNKTSVVTVTSPSDVAKHPDATTSTNIPIILEAPQITASGKPKYIPKDPADEEKFWSIMRAAAKATRGKTSFPTLKEIPATSFSCNDVSQPGFYADPETDCQAFHRCDIYGGQFRFLCPERTLFSQLTLVCDHWYNVNCQEQVKYADYINSRAYDFKRFGRYLGHEIQDSSSDLQPKMSVAISQLVQDNRELFNITESNNPLMNLRSGNITAAENSVNATLTHTGNATTVLPASTNAAINVTTVPTGIEEPN